MIYSVPTISGVAWSETKHVAGCGY